VASLREIQRSFAAALRDPAVTCAVLPPANLGVYRNNGAITFREALGQTFPVLRRRTGDDYFRQLSTHYRERFPPRSGDLHWTGRDFAVFLDDYLAGSEYQWLADLARVEWACAESSVAAERVTPPSHSSAWRLACNRRCGRCLRRSRSSASGSPIRPLTRRLWINPKGQSRG